MESFRIGVLWSTHVVRLVCFRVTSSLTTLTHVVRLNIDATNVKAAGDIIREWASKHLPKQADISAVVSLSEGALFVKELEVPRASQSEVTQAIQWELLTKNAAFPKDSVLAWLYRDGDPTSGKAVAYALRESESELIRDVFTDLGWSVSAIESYSTSFSRFQQLPTTPTVLVDLAGNQASLAIVEGQIARFATLVDLPQSEASSVAGSVTQTALTTLATHIRQTLSYWQSRSNKPVKHISVTGDTAESTTVKRYLSKPLGLELVPNSLKKTKKIRLGKLTEHALAEYAVPLGAMLRLTDYAYDQDINFLTHSARFAIAGSTSRRQLQDASRQIVAASLGLILVGLCVIGANLWLTRRYHQEIDQNTRFIQNHPAQKLVSEVNDVNSLAGVVKTLMDRQQDSGAKLAFFADHTPVGITYTAIKYTSEPKQEWVIEGTGTRTSVLAFYYELQSRAQEATITMPYSSLQRDTDSVFLIRIIW